MGDLEWIRTSKAGLVFGYDISDLSHNDYYAYTLGHINDYYAYTLGHIVTPLHKATRLEMVFLCPAWDTSAINQ